MARLAASASERRRTGLTVLDGPHLVGAYLDAGGAPQSLVVSRSGLASPEVARLVERAGRAPAIAVSDPMFEAISTVESPTGIMASVATPEGRPAPPDASLVLALDDIQDPGNVGTLLRSAAAAGAGYVLLSRHCAFAWSPKVLRAGMGAHFALDIVEGVDLGAWLAGYRGTSVALAGQGDRSLFALDLTGPVAFLVGNEGAGLSPALLAGAAIRARIPMAGRIESLNAGSAGTIALFEALRQRSRP